MESREDSVASAIGIGASLTKSMSLRIKSTVRADFHTRHIHEFQAEYL